jgi:GxxExxY protein
MPIIIGTELNAPPKKRFHEIDYRIMSEAFSVHNTFGQLMDETCYRKALLQRSVDLGYQSTEELEIRLTHKDFVKSYYIDLLVESSVIFELKSVEAFHPKHEAQLINYLLLCELPHGKLINFGASSVESRFVSTTIKRSDRSKFTLKTEEWHPKSETSIQIPEILTELLTDWGTHLDFQLYESALQHSVSTQESPVEIYDNKQLLGKKKMHLTSENTALFISGIQGNLSHYKQHLQRIITNTSLHRIQWINIYRSQITLTTIEG